MATKTASTKEAPKEPKVKCSVSWCQKDARSGGYCRQHYRRFKRQGSPISITGDVAAVLSVAKEAIAVVGAQAEKVHKANKHSSAFAACENGLCATYHQLHEQTKGVTDHGTTSTQEAA